MRNLLRESGKFVEVGREQAESMYLGCKMPVRSIRSIISCHSRSNILRNCPCDAKAVRSRSASSKFVNDDEGIAGGRL